MASCKWPGWSKKPRPQSTKFLKPYGPTILSSPGARSLVRWRLAVERYVVLTSLHLSGLPLLRGVLMQDREDVGQIVEHRRGRRRYCVALLRGSAETLATRPPEAAHRSSDYSCWQ